MRPHKKYIDHYDEKMALLVENIGDLRYDSLAEFLEALSQKLYKDGRADEVRGRVKLSSSLFQASKAIKDAKVNIDESWRISKPYMEDYESD